MLRQHAHAHGKEIKILKKCFVLQVNDAAVRLRLVVFVSKVPRFYIQITEQTRRRRGEKKGVPPL
jgi:hypothetical protein